MDYFLKADNEQTLMARLLEVGVVEQYSIKDEEGNVIDTKFKPAQGVNLDIIGTITKQTGNIIRHSNGIEEPEVEPLEGFHANLRCDINLNDLVEYIQYQPTEEEQMNPNFIMPAAQEKVTPSPIKDLLVYPKNPTRLWA